ncbi:MAG: hypothetical protein MI919_30580 [Holophagales bacterium]|nr:hypothetical protein [Holophagales bacterium]
MKRRLGTILSMLTLLALASGTLAAEEAQPAAEPAAAPTTLAEQAEPATGELPIFGMQAWIDAETGELRAPTAEEAARFSAALRGMFAKSQAEPEVRTHENGMVSVSFHESMLEFSVAHIGADGKIHRDCVDDAHHALEWIQQPATNDQPEEE